MKLAYIILLFLTASIGLFAQTPIGSANTTIAVKGGLSIDSALRIPMQPITNRYAKQIDTSRNIFAANTDTLPRYMKQGVVVKMLTEFDSNKIYSTTNYAINYGKLSVTGSGSQSLVVAAGYWLIGVSIRPTSTETIKIGLTPGGEEILVATSFTGGSNANINGIVNYFSATIATTIYFSGASGSVTYRILQQ